MSYELEETKELFESKQDGISLSYLIPEMFTTHCTTLHCENTCIVHTASSN